MDAGAEPAEVVLREERAVVAVERRVTGRWRLQRVVVRETRTIEVEVAHEEYRLVQDDDADVPAAVPPDDAPRRVSTVLREERIEIVRRVVPVERVTLVVDRMPAFAEVPVVLRREAVEALVPDPEGDPGR